jgi:hypothetical protein
VNAPTGVSSMSSGIEAVERMPSASNASAKRQGSMA